MIAILKLEKQPIIHISKDKFPYSDSEAFSILENKLLIK